MRIAIVGGGRVGRTLGERLREVGWDVGAVVTRSEGTARAAVRAIGAGIPYAGLTRHLLVADVVLIATPDSAVKEVARKLARMGGEEWRGKVVLHTSGALSSDELAPLARRGAATGSLHPMQTFSGRGAPRLDGINCAIEGAARALRVARQIARAIGGVPVKLAAADKPAYHAAAGFAAPHLLSVLETGTAILMKLGFTRRQATRALGQLARQTLENFQRFGPRASWTGPASRGDFGTVAEHVAALKQFPREYGAGYAALTLLAARLLAPKDGLTRRRLRSILGKV
jgi:predicted short-subunit dehydrogenase-like oxidoreductase (DUF2520 family)